MRIPSFLAAVAVALGLSATPAAAETRTATPATTLMAPIAQPGVPTASPEQYRQRYRNGYRPGFRQYRYRSYRPYRSYRYRPRYYANRSWRRGGVVCRTSWRYGRLRRVCWRR